MADFGELVGKTLSAVTLAEDHETMTFKTTDGESYRLRHEQDCCEYVYIEDVNGDLDDLVGSPLVQAEESSNREDGEDSYDSSTWTFYKLATNKGSVTIRWLGTSNGYYSESVDFEKLSDG